MLRKDVKLGFAIGGVMLAVVVVYVLVVPNNDARKTGLVTDDSQVSSNTETDSLTSDLKGGDKPSEPPAIDTAKVDAGKDDAAKTDIAKADNSKPDNVGEKSDVAITGPSTPAVDASKKGDIWDMALRNGVIPPSMSATPTATPSADKSTYKSVGLVNDKASDKSGDASSNSSKTDAMIADKDATAANGTGAAVDTMTTDATTDANSGAQLASDKQAPSKTAETTHVVKAGETLSSIAAAAYGDAKSWKRISEANPDVNPNRLAAGTHLVIPVAPANATASTERPGYHGGAANGGAVDPQTRYQVQASDSLYRISMRLYGKADHVDKLYEDNKDVIGADPRRLKLGMVLKLTDKPIASVSSASH